MTNSSAGNGLPLMATVNGVIDQLHGSLGLTDSDFFCECGHSACKERIRLTRTEYANLRDDHRPVLVADHAHRRPSLLAQAHVPRFATQASYSSGDPRGR